MHNSCLFFPDFSPSSASGAPRFYIGLKLLNKAGSDVILKSSDRNPEAGFKIKQGLVVKIIKTVASNQPVMFTALDGNGEKVILNNKMNIILKPSPIKGQPFTVAMTPAAGKERTFLLNIFSFVSRSSHS